MKISRWLILLPLLLLPSAGRADEPKKLAGEDRELQERINEAVDRGVAWLRKVPLRDGLIHSEFGAAGPSALALYTLLVSGVPKDDERVKELAASLEKLSVEEGSAQDLRSGPAALRMTYDHSLLVLALATLDAKEHRRAIARSVATLVRAQQSDGQWNYIVRMGGPLDGGDNSNTQFALLALRLAKREGFPVPDAVWRRAYAHFAESLAKDGGWGYGCEGTMEGTYGSMTAVGVASLVIARAMLLGDRAADHEYLKEPPIARGMIWLEDHFAADRNPGIADVEMGAPAGGPGGGPGGRPGGPGGAGPGGPGPGGPPPGMGAPAVPPHAFQYYWLYAVERVGMLLSRKYVGNHDWYREGAEWLLGQQQRDGSWANRDAGMMAPEPPLAATCFALLFLKKGTFPVVTPPPEVKRDPRPR